MRNDRSFFRCICGAVSAVMLTSLFSPAVPAPELTAKAEKKSPVVVVSLGDSYSAGEGIEPFYGQKNAKGKERSWEEKCASQDWLAHRSTLSWPGKLTIPGVSGTMVDYKATGDDQVDSDECRWYFRACTGATTWDFDHTQGITVFKGVFSDFETYTLPKQLSIFDTIENKGETVNYVTMTIGGNDIGFADVINICAKNNYAKRDRAPLDDAINEVWENMESTKADIKNVYIKTADAAGDQAEIYIAGYPKLFSPKGSGVLIDAEEAAKVNQNVHDFNEVLRGLVAECNNEGYKNIYYVDVETEFDKDGGHGAYSKDAWINSIKLLKKSEDHINSSFAGLGSSYSIHPNKDGTDAYARCVSSAISENKDKKDNAGKSGNRSDTAVYAIKGAEWVVDPTIDADDIIVGDKRAFASDYSCPYVYIERGGKYGLIGYDGEIAVEPEYDSFNGDDFYGLDDFIAVYDSKSGDTMFAQNYNTDDKGKWEIVEQEKAYGQPGIGTWTMTYFIDENDGALYRYNWFDEQPEAISDGPDTSYVVQKIDYVPSKYGIGDSSASDEKFYLYNAILGDVTDGYKYVYSNGYGVCTYAGAVGERFDVSGYKTAAFSDDMKKWDIYDSYGELIASDLEPFGCNLDLTPWWSPATAFFDDADDYDSAENTYGKAVPFCATEGYIAAKIDGEYGYLDLDGNVVVPFGILDDVRPVHNGKAWAKFEGKWGVLSFE